MNEKNDKLIYCENGSCVDITRVNCAEKFDNIHDVIECELMQEMAN